MTPTNRSTEVPSASARNTSADGRCSDAPDLVFRSRRLGRPSETVRDRTGSQASGGCAPTHATRRVRPTRPRRPRGRTSGLNSHEGRTRPRWSRATFGTGARPVMGTFRRTWVMVIKCRRPPVCARSCRGWSGAPSTTGEGDRARWRGQETWRPWVSRPRPRRTAGQVQQGRRRSPDRWRGPASVRRAGRPRRGRGRSRSCRRRAWRWRRCLGRCQR